MGKYERERGKRNERLAAKAIERTLGIPARRTAQSTGVHGVADVDMGVGFHPEVKVRKSIAACRYYEQAQRDHTPGNTPFVVMREDRGPWMVMLALSDIPDFIRAIHERQIPRTQHDAPDPSTDSAGSGPAGSSA